MNVLFVCTGNTCRSPMAEGYLNSLALKDVTAKSVGMSFSGDMVAENSVIAMSELGIDISRHRSTAITMDHIYWADKIICMTASHRNSLLSLGVSKEKLSVLGGGIPDPFCGDITVYRDCRDTIIKAIDELFNMPVISFMDDETVADDIEIIEKQCFSTPWSKKAILESYSHGTRFILAKVGSKTVGYMGISTVLDEGYITNIAVLPEFRKRGIASAILDFCVDFSKQNKLSFITLEVRESNENAIKLYEKFGFVKEGTRKNFYTNPTENALILTRRFK